MDQVWIVPSQNHKLSSSKVRYHAKGASFCPYKFPVTSKTAIMWHSGMPPFGCDANKGRNLAGRGPASKNAPLISPSWRTHLFEEISCITNIRPIWLRVGDWSKPVSTFYIQIRVKVSLASTQRLFTRKVCGSSSITGWFSSKAFWDNDKTTTNETVRKLILEICCMFTIVNTNSSFDNDSLPFNLF